MTKKRHKIEDQWHSKGFECVVLALDMGHRCGYVGIPKDHPLHGVGYGDPSEVLGEMWEKAKDGPIGKRGIIPIFCATSADDTAPRPDVVFDVHGGITYSGGSDEYPAPNDGLWWFGFDAGHCGDAKDESIMSQEMLDIERRFMSSMAVHGTVRDLQYMKDECERLASQLQEVSRALDVKSKEGDKE